MTNTDKPHRRIENGKTVLDLGKVHMSFAAGKDIGKSKPDETEKRK